ncbi:MAG: T9SS type A sorting domain-containing protein, partial [Sediminibacterium sp.]|nr:T9SS type A sorting domain-containing protein [Sediminibacterium sp.]
ADSYQKGRVLFPLPELSEGTHQITLKAWDIANNSAEKTLQFWVKKKEKLSIGRVMNFPNPFEGSTTFSIEHNRPGMPLRVEINIFDVWGRWVHRIEQNLGGTGSRNIQIQWGGVGASGAKLTKGIYIYHLKLISETETAEARGRMIRY